MAKFFPFQRVRYVGVSQVTRLRDDPRPLTRHGEQGTFLQYIDLPEIDVVICAVRMDSGIVLGCRDFEIEPIVPDGLEPIEEILAMIEPEPETVKVKR